MSSSRVHKSLLNVQVGIFFYILSLLLTFFSRRIFLENLGFNFIGLTGTLNNILGFLNLAELGISSCVCYFLFKPLETNNREQINEILSVLGFIYRRIGFGILLAGSAVSAFFPLIFKSSDVSFSIVYFAYYSFLSSSVIGYFINYKQILLTADQKNYVAAGYIQTIGIIKTGLQIFLAYYYKNLYMWVFVEFIFSVIVCILLNNRIRNNYRWLDTNAASGKTLLKKYPDILVKTKQIFIQKIKDFVLNKSDEIMIFAFTSLKMVAYYGNYMIIINKIIYLVNVASDGMGAGVGNLVAENKPGNTMKVFWELTALRFIIVGAVVYTLFLFMQPFISCWLGKEYILDEIVLYLLLVNIFLMLSRGVVEMYIHAHGLYADVWASWTEVIVNVIVTLIAAHFYGIVGILLGKILSVAGIALLWKPYYLFKAGLKQPPGAYWKGMASYYAIFAGFMLMLIPLKYYMIDKHVHNWATLLLYAGCILIPLMLAYIIFLFLLTNGMRFFLMRIPALSNILKKGGEG